MSILVALPADLAPSPAAFVSDWNSDSESIDIAIATVPAADPLNYSADIVNTILIAFTGATAKTTFDMIFQQLRARYFRKGKEETITIKTRQLDDGTEVTEVTMGN